MRLRNISLTLLTVIFLAGADAQAQLNPAQTGLNAAMTKLFGDFTAFSSKAEVRMLDPGDKESIALLMDFTLLDGKMRADIDMATLKNKEFPPEVFAQFKQMGMDRMTTVVRPDKKTTLLIYPALQAYAELVMSKESQAELAGDYKVEKIQVGKETAGGHPCEKYKVTVRGSKGEKHEAFVWNATDFQKFPVQIQMNEPNAKIVFVYKDIKLARPEAKQFEVPAGFTKYDSVEKLMQGAMGKMLGK